MTEEREQWETRLAARFVLSADDGSNQLVLEAPVPGFETRPDPGPMSPEMRTALLQAFEDAVREHEESSCCGYRQSTEGLGLTNTILFIQRRQWVGSMIGEMRLEPDEIDDLQGDVLETLTSAKG